MKAFWEFYDWFERACWGSLTRKLSSFLLLFFIDVAYLGIYLHQKGDPRTDDVVRCGSGNAGQGGCCV